LLFRANINNINNLFILNGNELQEKMMKLNKLFTTLLFTIIISMTYQAKASLMLLEPEDIGYTTAFKYTAWCYDCDEDNIGEVGDGTEVTGTIVLANYILGTQFDLSNFISFSYDGPSNHVQSFKLSYDDENIADVISSFHGSLGNQGESWQTVYLQWESAQFGSSFYSQLKSDSFKMGPGENGPPGDPDAGDFDFGDKVSFSVVNQVPEPSTLVIFALGVMGLISRRFSKVIK
jgi:hypothetical protein